MIDAGTLGGSIAWDINEQAQVVGESFTGGVPGGAFLWEDGVMANLGTLGGNGSEAFGINDLGQVVGRSTRSDSSIEGFLWEDGEMIDLSEVVGESIGSAEAINNAGHIISGGSLYDPVNGFRLVTDLLPPDSGWFQITFRDINESGRIVGVGTFEGRRRAFLMTPPQPPIPTMSPWGAVVLTLLLLAAGTVLARRRVHSLR